MSYCASYRKPTLELRFMGARFVHIFIQAKLEFIPKNKIPMCGVVNLKMTRNINKSHTGPLNCALTIIGYRHNSYSKRNVVTTTGVAKKMLDTRRGSI